MTPWPVPELDACTHCAAMLATKTDEEMNDAADLIQECAECGPAFRHALRSHGVVVVDAATAEGSDSYAFFHPPAGPAN